jgi:acyl carrier protein
MSEVQQSIEDRVKKIIREQMALYSKTPEVIANDFHLAKEAHFDSLDLVEATMGIEDEFGIYIDDDEMTAFTTVQSVVDCVTANVKA